MNKNDHRNQELDFPTLARDSIQIWLATLPCAVLLDEAALVAGDAGVAALVEMMMVVAGKTG